MIIWILVYVLLPAHNEAFTLSRSHRLHETGFHRATRANQDWNLKLESPFGVRKRVRAALDRAKKRTPMPESSAPVLVTPSTNNSTIEEEPLPFTLPTLNSQQRADLSQGQRIQVQENMGRQGYGYVVVDVLAPVDVVWNCLLDFNSYPDIIPTVRGIQMLTNTHLSQDYHSEAQLTNEEIRKLYEDGTLATLQFGVPSVTRAVFTLSKFQLKIAAIHKYRTHPLGDYMIFTLDPACTNLVLQMAKGTWYTQSNPDGKGQQYTRVWLLCELKVSPILPQFITDYAAARAMPRATTWIKPHVEAAASLWLKKSKDPSA